MGVGMLTAPTLHKQQTSVLLRNAPKLKPVCSISFKKLSFDTLNSQQVRRDSAPCDERKECEMLMP